VIRLVVLQLGAAFLVAACYLASCAAIDRALGGDPGPAPQHDLVPVEHGGGATPMFLRRTDAAPDALAWDFVVPTESCERCHDVYQAAAEMGAESAP